MSYIKRTKRNQDEVVVELGMSYEEYLNLEGHLEDIHLVAEKPNSIKTNMSQRGTNGATKYFLIPRELRKGFKINNAISCQRIDTEQKALFIYIVDKLRINPSKREIILRKYEEELAEIS